MDIVLGYERSDTTGATPSEIFVLELVQRFKGRQTSNIEHLKHKNKTA